MAPLELDRLAALGQDADPLGVGPEGADDDALPSRRVRAEQVVRVRVISPDDELDFVSEPSRIGLLEQAHDPATGTDTQSGRLASS